MPQLILLLLSLFLLSTPGCSSGRSLAKGVTADTIAPDELPRIILADSDGYVMPEVSNAPKDSLTTVITQRLSTLVGDDIFERTQLGLYVYDLTTDSPVFSHGEHQQMRPASCQKIVTAVTALSELGTDYLYRTRLYVDGDITDSILHGNVYLRGGFDPLIGRSDLLALTEALTSRGVGSIDGRVVFDRTFKDTASLGWGWCWDDDTTPLTPLLYDKRPGLERRFLNAIREAGIACNDSVQYDTTPHGAEQIAERAHTIDQVLLQMMKQSDNLYAESLFYQIGAQANYPYADHRCAVSYVKKLLDRIGISSNTYQIADGSGLSLYNYLTPHLLVGLLRYAWRDEAIRRHLLPSLPIAGEDGTLRRRMTSGNARGNVRAKTGTVEGVSSLAGYCTAANGHTLCFAIINQGVRKTSTGRNFQDRVCRALTDN